MGDMPSIKVWDPNDSSTKYEEMHIITPSFPAMNSTHNVSTSTCEVLKREIARAFHLLSRAERNINESKWNDLFAANTFFIDHKRYIFVKAAAPYKNLTEWSGLIESKIRNLVNNLEQHPNVQVVPYCKAIKLKLTRKAIQDNMHPQALNDEKRNRLRKRKLQRMRKQREKEQEEQNMRLRKIQLDLQREREAKQLKQEQMKQQMKREETIQIDQEDTPDTGEGSANEPSDAAMTNKEEKEETSCVQVDINMDDGQKNVNMDGDVMIISNLSVPISPVASKSQSIKPKK